MSGARGCPASTSVWYIASLQALQDEFKGMQAVQPRKDKEEVDTGLELVNKRLPKQQRDKALKEVRQCGASRADRLGGETVLCLLSGCSPAGLCCETSC